jgi:hypothetical protein
MIPVYELREVFARELAEIFADLLAMQTGRERNPAATWDNSPAEVQELFRGMADRLLGLIPVERP